MKKRILFVLVIFFVLPIFLLSYTPPPKYSFTFDNKSYDIYLLGHNWGDAAAFAVGQGGYLAEINSAGEQQAIYDAIMNGAQVPIDYTTVFDGGGIAYVWIGATDKNEEGTWLWDGNDDGEGIHFWSGEGNAGAGGGSAIDDAYIFWGGSTVGSPNEPDNYSGQDAAGIALEGWPAGSGNLGMAGEWNDIKMTNLLYFVIEYDSLLGTEENNYRSMQVYPNPAKDFISFNNSYFTPNEVLNIKVFDLSGKCVLEENADLSKLKQLNIQELESGMYIVSVASGDTFLQTRKFIKH